MSNNFDMLSKKPIVMIRYQKATVVGQPRKHLNQSNIEVVLDFSLGPLQLMVL